MMFIGCLLVIFAPAVFVGLCSMSNHRIGFMGGFIGGATLASLVLGFILGVALIAQGMA